MAKKKVEVSPALESESVPQSSLELATELHELVSRFRPATVISGHTLASIKEYAEKIFISVGGKTDTDEAVEDPTA